MLDADRRGDGSNDPEYSWMLMSDISVSNTHTHTHTLLHRSAAVSVHSCACLIYFEDEIVCYIWSFLDSHYNLLYRKVYEMCLCRLYKLECLYIESMHFVCKIMQIKQKCKGKNMQRKRHCVCLSV